MVTLKNKICYVYASNEVCMLSAIVAIDQNNVIGNHNKLPWHLPADLNYFKQVTLNKTIIMGRKTFESIGRPLPHRKNMIVTRDKNFKATACEIIYSIDDVIAMSQNNDEEFFLIGGAELFNQLLPHVKRLYLTLVHHTFEGDAFFPEIDFKEWNEISRVDYPADEKNAYSYSFLVLGKN